MNHPSTGFTINELLRRILFLPPQASSVAADIDHLHFFVILTTMAGATAITVVGVYLLIRYRSRGPEFRPEDPRAHPPRWAEVGVISGLLGLFCLWWLIGFAQYVRLQVPPDDALTVYVTGKQWMWKFAYPDGEHTISTLVVPTSRPVKLLLASRDVIHSFYVPDFRIKQDAVPGRYTTAWFEVKAPGTHMVLCAEYCGTGHSSMRGQVVALTPEDYARWKAGARTTEEPGGPVAEEGTPPGTVSLARKGIEVAGELGCLRCHTIDGSPHIGPTWAGDYRAVVAIEDGKTIVADEAYLTESMMDPLAHIRAGFQPVMPTYQGVLSPGQIGAIIELIKSIRSVPPQPSPTAPGPVGVAALAPPTGAPAGPAGKIGGTPPPLPLLPVPRPRLPIRVEAAR